MADSNPYVDFLSQPDNLRIALQVEEHLQEVKDHIHETFWRLIEEHVGRQLETKGFTTDWHLEHRSEYPLTGKFGGLRIVPTDHEDCDISVVANIQQRHYSDYRVQYGIWPHPFEKRTGDRYKTVDKELRGQFSELGYITDKMKGAPVQCQTDLYARRRNTLLSVAAEMKGKPGVAHEMARRFFTFFETHRETLETMNDRLRR